MSDECKGKDESMETEWLWHKFKIFFLKIEITIGFTLIY